MFRLLIDSCVWLDLAKDYQQQALLSALEQLIARSEVELILPRIITEEFQRNKGRILEESRRSLSGTIKRVKEVVRQHGNSRKRNMVIDQLNDVDHRLPTMGDTSSLSIGRIEALFAGARTIEVSDDVKRRAAERALDHRAPFHRQRNGIADAILIEVYADFVSAKPSRRTRYAFISHNTKDFSQSNGDQRRPHPDIAASFSKVRSLYFITLGEALRRVEPQFFSDLMIEEEYHEEPRRLSEILSVIDELTQKIWYDRHQVWLSQIESGDHKIVEKVDFSKGYQAKVSQRDIYEGALRAAAKVEKKYGRDGLGPWTKFEWGMLNGKLSALRWVIGDEWDVLDT